MSWASLETGGRRELPISLSDFALICCTPHHTDEMGCAQSNQSKDDGAVKAGASHDDVALVESRAAAAKFYEKQLAERDARIAALEQVLKEKGVAVPEQKKSGTVSEMDKDSAEEEPDY